MDLRDDGTIVMALLDGPHTLRQITFGEYQKLRTASAALNENLPEEEKAAQDEFWKRCIGWWQEAFGLLADKPGPDDVNDWPEWCGNSSAIVGALRHWRTVPLASGGKA